MSPAQACASAKGCEVFATLVLEREASGGSGCSALDGFGVETLR